MKSLALALIVSLLLMLAQLCRAQSQGALVKPSGAVSRLTHGSAGPFDVVLPLAGKPGIECRSGNGGNYTIILTFPETVTFSGAVVTTAGPGYSGSIAGTSDGATPSTQVSVNLANASDGQTIKLALHAVRHETNNGAYQNDVSVEMGIRIGDVDGSGVVTTSDRTSINGQIGAPVTSSNFREDVNNDGAITTSDRSLANGNLNKTLNYTTFSFTLDGPYQTSAGVFKDGRLIRTLWSNTHYPGGIYTSTWDGNNDYGVPAAAGTYEIRLLQHNVQYVFDGAIGNTSATQVGPGVHNNSCFMRSLAIDGTHAYYAIGESEGEIPASHFETTAPQTRTSLIAPSISTGFDIVATDGDKIYVSNGGAGWDYALNGSFTTFVTAHNVSDNSEYAFPNGADITKDSTHTYHGCIDANVWLPSPGPTPGTQDNPNQPTGLAVQKGSGKNVLAIAHGGPGGPNQIRLFDKITGAPLPQTISISNPQSLGMDSNGDLWVISWNALKRFTNLSSTPALAQTITGFSEPIAVAVSPTNPDLVLVADGGTKQQVRAFDRTADTASNQLWRFGKSGGWNASNGPDVTDTPPTFQFKVGGIGDILRTALAVAADGSFYVGDGATNRLLHVNDAHNGIIESDTIMFLTKHNWTAADPNNPRRVFGDGWLEFDVDYTKPIQSAWTLKKNWAAGVDPYYTSGENSFNGLRVVTTLSNGRVYGIVHGSSSQNENIVVELPESIPNSPLRICQDGNGSALALEIIHQADEFRDLQQPAWMGPDGAIRYPKWSNPANPQIEFWEKALSSFDANGNPQWATAVNVASAPYSDGDPSSFNDVENVAYPLTSGNKIVIFEPGIQKLKLSDGSFIQASGLHLGAIAKGDTQWSWRASSGVTADLPFDDTGSFDLGDGVGIAGLVVKGVGKHLIYSYPGESWNGSEASQWMHFYDDGLFVGQFGTSGDYGISFEGARPGFSGNSFYSTLVGVGLNNLPSADGDLYLYSNDQADHSGVIQWHIVGAAAIREQNAIASLGSTVSLTGPAAAFPTGLTATPGNGQIKLSWTPVPGASLYTVKQATLGGGPYTTVKTTSLSNCTVSGLSNATPYVFVVSADTSMVDSTEVRAFPFKTVGIAGQMTGGLPGARLAYVPIDSTAPSRNQPAVVGLDQLFGNLSRRDIGTKGYVLYNWADGGSSTSSQPVPYTVANNYVAPITGVNVDTTPGISDWFNQNAGAASWFLIDGQIGSSDRPCLNLHSGSNGAVDITVSDNKVHYLTVFSPSIGSNPRTCTLTLTLKNQSTPSASYMINDAFGVNHVLQFVFTGSVTLRYTNVTGPFNSEGGGLQALFFD